eukprot:evm.model.scf_2617.1 EVM.evm.TU.scf_2617.1   scf_2617:3405-6591(-)
MDQPCHSKAAAVLNDLIARVARRPLGLLASSSMRAIRLTINAESLHIAYLLSLLGCRLCGMDYQAEAETFHRRALCIGAKLLGGDHPSLADAMEWLSYSLYRQGNFKEAVLLCASATVLIQGAFGPCHPFLANCYWNLATVVEAMGLKPHGGDLRARASSIVSRSLDPWLLLRWTGGGPPVAEDVAKPPLLQGAGGTGAQARGGAEGKGGSGSSAPGDVGKEGPGREPQSHGTEEMRSAPCSAWDSASLEAEDVSNGAEDGAGIEGMGDAPKAVEGRRKGGAFLELLALRAECEGGEDGAAAIVGVALK